MDEESRKRFERIEANFERAERRAERAEARWEREERKRALDHKRYMEGIDRVERRREEAHRRDMERIEVEFKKTMARMDKFDRQLQATRRLVQAGMKIVVHMARDTRELKQLQKTFIDSLLHAGNGAGSGRKHGNWQ